MTKFRKAPTGYEIRFRVDAEKELFELANTARLAMDALGTEQDKVIPAIKNLKDDVERCKKAMKSQKIEAKEESVNYFHFVYAVFEDMDKRVLTDKANELVKDKTVLCFHKQVRHSAGYHNVLAGFKQGCIIDCKGIKPEAGRQGRRKAGICNVLCE